MTTPTGNATPKKVDPHAVADQSLSAYNSAMQSSQQDAQLAMKPGTDPNTPPPSAHGTDPDFVTNEEQYDGLSHQDIWDNVNGANKIDASLLHQYGQQWGKLVQALETAWLSHDIRMNQVMNDRWKGTAAEAAHKAVVALVTSGMHFTDTSDSTGQRVSAAAYAAEAVKALVPPVPSPSQASTFDLLVPKAAFEGGSFASAERASAVRAMKTVYSPSYLTTGKGVQSYEPPPAGPGGDSGVPSGGNTGNSGGGGGSRITAGGSGSTTPTDPNGRQAGQGDQQGGTTATPASSTAAGGHSGLGAGAGSGAGGHGGESTHGAGDAAGRTSAAGVSGGGGLPGAELSGLDGGADAGGGGGFGGLASDGGAPGSLPGRGLSGNTASGAALAGAGAASAGRSGAGMPGMGMPGAHGRKEADKEHKTPDYLRTAANTELLLGGLPKVSPPVLGAWDESTTDETREDERQ